MTIGLERSEQIFEYQIGLASYVNMLVHRWTVCLIVDEGHFGDLSGDSASLSASERSWEAYEAHLRLDNPNRNESVGRKPLLDLFKIHSEDERSIPFLMSWSTHKLFRPRPSRFQLGALEAEGGDHSLRER
jgi:hypothetical protein